MRRTVGASNREVLRTEECADFERTYLDRLVDVHI